MVSKVSTAPLLRVFLTLNLFVQILFVQAQAPTHTGKFNFIDENINGFWEYLPGDFQVNAQLRYPLLIFIHGSGESGSVANQATLDKVLTAGTPKLIASGKFPESFTVNRETYQFIVLSPQIKNGLQVEGTVGTSIIEPSTIEAVIQYAKKAYPNRIDESRIYLAGLSMGGGAIWDYAGSSTAAAKKIAAIVVAAGAGNLNTQEANNIAAAKLPVLTTHNNVDDIVLAQRTRDNIIRINGYSPAIIPAPVSFYWDSPGSGFDGRHNVWSRTFEDLLPNATAGGNLVDVLGFSAYQWLLQFNRASALPVKWESVSAQEVNSKVFLEWSVSVELNLKNYEVERSSDGSTWTIIATLKPSANTNLIKKYSYTDQQPPHQLNYYRIKQTDLDGKFTYSVVKSVDLTSLSNKIQSFPNPFTDKIDIYTSNLAGKKITVAVVSGNGAVLRTESFQLTGNQFRISINNLRSLTKGIYYLVARNESGNIIYNGKVWKNN